MDPNRRHFGPFYIVFLNSLKLCRLGQNIKTTFDYIKPLLCVIVSQTVVAFEINDFARTLKRLQCKIIFELHLHKFEVSHLVLEISISPAQLVISNASIYSTGV